MSLPDSFLEVDNFQLAFERVARGQNRDYKDFFRHLIAPYRIALRENLDDLVGALRRGHYQPESPDTVYRPKKTGVLRPQRVLCLKDQIVYQAMGNLIAKGFSPVQRLSAGRCCFGAQLSDSQSPFFFRAWKPSYRAFGQAVRETVSRGRDFVAEFDLVSFYELVDHGHLRRVLFSYCSDHAVLDLLFRCLQRWTAIEGAPGVHHGLPQGPETSALLAECFLLPFDQLKFSRITYLRYIDDVKLFAENELVARRGLIRLDIESKKLGLVPQAQKLRVRRVSDASDILKVLPSSVAAIRPGASPTRSTQARLERVLLGSIDGRGKARLVVDETRFKFALYRLAPRRRLASLIRPLFFSRPDLSSTFTRYLERFKPTAKIRAYAAHGFRGAVYDATAADFLRAYRNLGDVPERSILNEARRAIGASEEKGVSLRFAYRSLVGTPKSLERLRSERPIVQSLTLDALLAHAHGKRSPVRAALMKGLASQDEDLARFCADRLLPNWTGFYLVRRSKPSWLGRRRLNRSVKLYLRGLGFATRRPARRTLLPDFFQKEMKIAVRFPWSKAVPRQADRLELERRCLELRLYSIRAPDESVLMLDSFNEGLVQAFSRSDPTLAASFQRSAKRNNAQPDYGAWLKHGDFLRALPTVVPWLQQTHDTRISSQIGHSKQRGGAWTGPISHSQRDQLWKTAPAAWAQLLVAWKLLL